jgi:hypothetical protein
MSPTLRRTLSAEPSVRARPAARQSLRIVRSSRRRRSRSARRSIPAIFPRVIVKRTATRGLPRRRPHESHGSIHERRTSLPTAHLRWRSTGGMRSRRRRRSCGGQRLTRHHALLHRPLRRARRFSVGRSRTLRRQDCEAGATRTVGWIQRLLQRSRRLSLESSRVRRYASAVFRIAAVCHRAALRISSSPTGSTSKGPWKIVMNRQGAPSAGAWNMVSPAGK